MAQKPKLRVAVARGNTPQAYNVGADELDLRSAWGVTHSIQLMMDRDYENRIKLIKDTWQQREVAEFHG